MILPGPSIIAICSFIILDAAPISLLYNINDEAAIDLNVGGKIFLTSFATLKR